MDDRIKLAKRERLLRELKRKIRDPLYVSVAVQRLAGKLTQEYYQRTQRGQNN